MNRKTTSIAEQWEKLQKVQGFSIRVRNISDQTQFIGRGTVSVNSSIENQIVFTEQGSWIEGAASSLEFGNSYHWSLTEEKILLDHLREGPAAPVKLCELAPHSSTEWKSLKPHQCNKDQYSATLSFQKNIIALQWKVIGPKKNQIIRYQYSFYTPR